MSLRKSTVCMILGFLLMIKLIYQNCLPNYVLMKDNLNPLRVWYNYSNSEISLLNGPEISMDDTRVIARIREKFLILPSPPDVPYNLSNPKVTNPSAGQTNIILGILGQQKEGFFVECGGWDGERLSNTLYLERHLNWSGLLIEADPLNFAQIITKNRKAYLSPTCLSTKPYPILVSFFQDGWGGNISEKSPGHGEKGYVDVQCFPLYSYLLALNRTRVDYFSLDVERAELKVLKTIPFEKLDIRTLSVERIWITKEERKEVRNFLEKKGYTFHSDHPKSGDFIFFKTGISKF